MADLQKTVAIVFDATDLTADNIAAIQKGLNGLKTEAGDAGIEAEKAADQIDKIGDTEDSILSVKNAMVALAGSFVVQQFLDANSNAEKLNASLIALTGSSEGAQDALGYIQDVAGKMGTDVNEVAGAFVKWSAATQGTAIEGDKAKNIFEAFAGTIAKMGGDTNDVAGAMTQLAQGASKGRYELEDLKSIAERVPGFFQTMADSIGVSTGKLFDMVSQGEITGDTMVAVADKLKEKYGDLEYVDTFEAAWARMKNALNGFAVEAGQDGPMDKLKNAINVVAAAVDALNDKLGNVEQPDFGATDAIQLASPGGPFSLITDKVFEIAAAWLKVRDSIDDADSIVGKFLVSIDGADAEGLAQIKTVLDQMFDAGTIDAQAYEAIQNAILQKASGNWPGVAQDIAKAGDETGKLTDKTKDVDAALKGLGLDPDKIGDQTDAILGHFDKLVNSSAAQGDQILAGLLVSIDQVDKSGLPQLAAALDKAFGEGKISADQYAAGLNAIETAADGMWPAADKATGAVDKQAKALKDAEKAAQDAQKEANNFAIAMAKIEADLAGKVIDAKVKLDIAQIEADAKVATAIMDGIVDNFKANLDFIGDLAGMLSDTLSSPKDQYLKSLMDDAAKRADELHGMQMKVIQAQVDYMAAKTSAMANGNPIMTVQADGLAPHLEAFMWEVFKQIQIKMAYDGADMLVGGCSL